MNVVWENVEDGGFVIGQCHSAGLFDEVSEGVAFVEQPQFAVGGF